MKWGRGEEGELLTVFTHLQIIGQIDHIGDDIVRPGRKVHITDRAPRDNKARQHLRQIVGGDTIAKASIEDGALEQVAFSQRHLERQGMFWGGGATHKGGNDDSHHQRNNVRPGRKSDVLFAGNDEAKDEAADKHRNVPPPRRLLVMLGHVCMMWVIIGALPGALICAHHLSTPEENAVEDEGTDLGDS